MARRLFLVRRAERNLMSYERTGVHHTAECTLRILLPIAGHLTCNVQAALEGRRRHVQVEVHHFSWDF